MGARVAIVVLLAALPAVASAAARPPILGTARADLLGGQDGSDRVQARAGNDRIAVEYDGGADRVSCGPGVDVVAADLLDRIDADCEIVSRRIHRDRHVDPNGQHESEVEPDSLTVGATTVAVFQVGRRRDGGASSIGFSTSKDGGRTWRQGLLPGVTVNSVPRGPAERASDPVIAYDAAHGVWLANTLSITPGATRLTINRSTDGLRWSAPIDAALAQRESLAYDKNWIVCDNGGASPFRGRCYLAYTLVSGRDELAVQRSDDGGRTWSAPVTMQTIVTGVIPVVLPSGRLVLSFWSDRTGMVSVTSADGGLTLDPPVVISPFRHRDARPFRAPPLIAADVDTAGRVVTVWQDCRFRPECDANDIVLSRSADGTTWSTPTRVTSGRNAVMPTIGVEPGTGRLAVVYYVIHPNGIDAELVTSADGTRWSAPQRLNPRRMPLEWMPQTTPLGRMLADYIGVTWARGRPLVVYVLASPPRNGKLRQAVYAARG